MERWNTRPPIEPGARDLLSLAVQRALAEESARRETAPGAEQPMPGTPVAQRNPPMNDVDPVMKKCLND